MAMILGQMEALKILDDLLETFLPDFAELIIRWIIGPLEAFFHGVIPFIFVVFIIERHYATLKRCNDDDEKANTWRYRIVLLYGITGSLFTAAVLSYDLTASSGEPVLKNTVNPFRRRPVVAAANWTLFCVVISPLYPHLIRLAVHSARSVRRRATAPLSERFHLVENARLLRAIVVCFFAANSTFGVAGVGALFVLCRHLWLREPIDFGAMVTMEIMQIAISGSNTVLCVGTLLQHPPLFRSLYRRAKTSPPKLFTITQQPKRGLQEDHFRRLEALWNQPLKR